MTGITSQIAARYRCYYHPIHPKWEAKSNANRVLTGRGPMWITCLGLMRGGAYTDPMFRISVPCWVCRAAVCVAGAAVVGLQPIAARAWGSAGHRIVNSLAARSLPAGIPAFLRSPAAIEEIEYLGPEPDRWRSPADPELSAAQAPEHFIDLELADALGPLSRHRFEFLARAYAAGRQPEKIGLLPWETEEVWERLESAMRDYRKMQAAGQDSKPVEETIIFYAGWLGHYVADGSQPLHTTVQSNGWEGADPEGYTRRHGIHHRFETLFVEANIRASDVAPKMTPVRAISGDMFDAIAAYLRQTHGRVDELYRLAKAGGFAGEGTPASRAFTAQRLAAGASMLRDMIYTAWIDSARPAPERRKYR